MKSYLSCYLESVKENPGLPTLRELERDYLVFLLGLTRHNITRVSQILAISRTGVYHMIDRYDLSNPS